MRYLSTFGFLCSAFLLLSLASPLTAQTTFQRTYGGVESDYGYSVAQTTDGGYVIAGDTKSFGAGDYDAWLIKTDASGDTLWTRTFGGTDNDYGRSVSQTADGGYVITGYTESFGAGDKDAWLIKTDMDGDTIWTRTYGDSSYDTGWSVAQTADSGYVITGETYSFGAGYGDVWLIKTDADGNAVWTRTFGGTGCDRGYSVAQTLDGGYVIAGYTYSFGAGLTDVWLIKTDALGDTIWTRTFGGTLDDNGRSVAQTTDGGYVIAGYTRSFGAGGNDVWLVKTDASGDTMWTRAWGGTDTDRGHSVAQTADGGYIITGWTWSFGAGIDDVWLIKTDAWGDTIWTRTYGGTYWDVGYSVAQTTDGGYVIAGDTRSFGAGQEDVWLIKTDAAGNSPAIAEPQPPVAYKPVPATIVRGVLLCPVWSATTPSLRNVSDIALHNSAGRKVMALHPGDNDVRHLSPGVYFARGKGPRVQGSEGSSRKVILTR